MATVSANSVEGREFVCQLTLYFKGLVMPRLVSPFDQSELIIL